MSTVEELGYDPNEWEECSSPENFLAFGLFTRVCFSIFAIVFCILFFWKLESRKNKKDDLIEKNENIKRVMFFNYI